MALANTAPAAAGDFRLSKPAELTLFALCVAQAVFLAASFALGHWMIDTDGHGVVTDFVNVWAAGGLVLEGHPVAVYDPTIHKAAEDAALGRGFDGYFPWFYPPPFLFVATLLALMPYLTAFAVWVLVTFPAYAFTIRAIIGHRLGLLLAFAFPAVTSNAIVGQNGFVTAALLGSSLLAMERRPILSGVLLGLLAYKPHFGLLFPLVLAVSGRWRVFLAAAATVAVMVVLSWFAFGAATCEAFVRSLPLASQSMLRDGHGDFSKMHSALGLVRALGGGDTLAFVLQTMLTGVSAIVVCVMWRRKVAFDMQAAALATAALLATPYLYVYDLVVLAIPMAFLIRAARASGFLRGEIAWLGAASLCILLFPAVHAPIGLAAVLIVAMLVIRRAYFPPAKTTLGSALQDRAVA
jgi:arabinofuranan 3-O-arabinosyltransferase